MDFRALLIGSRTREALSQAKSLPLLQSTFTGLTQIIALPSRNCTNQGITESEIWFYLRQRWRKDALPPPSSYSSVLSQVRLWDLMKRLTRGSQEGDGVMDPYLRSTSFQLYPYTEDLGASKSHLRETAFLVLKWETPRIQPVKTLELSRPALPRLGRETPLRRT